MNQPSRHSGPGLRRALLRFLGFLERPSRQVTAAAGIIGAAVIASFVHGQVQGYEEAVARAERDTRNAAVLLAEHASRSLSAVEQTLRAVDRLRGDVARGIYRSRDSIYVHLKALAGSSQLLSEAGWFDSYGFQAATSLHVDPPGISLADDELFEMHRAAERPLIHLSPTPPARGREEGGIDVSLGLQNLDGSFAGIALGHIDVNEFESIYRSLNIGASHAATLARADGTVLVGAHGGATVDGDRSAARTTPADAVGTYRISYGRTEGSRIGSYARARGAADGLIVDVSVASRDALSGFLRGLAIAALEVVFALVVLGAGARLIVVGLRRRERLQAELAEATAHANAARAEAENANRAKSEFLARMSHELRTPLNAVIGFGQMLELDLSRNLSPQQKGYCRDVVSSGEHLLKLVNEVLDLSGVEAGRVPLTLETLSVTEALTGVAEIMMPVAAKASVMLDVKRVGEIPPVRADALRLRQALINLVGNAVKYNRSGGAVTLSALTRGGRVRLIVADTGRGIPAERQAELFEPFHRLGAEYTAVEGTGLGLALAKRLIEAMAGSLGFVSTVGMGSTFWIDLPVDGTRIGENPASRGESEPQSIAS